MIEPLHNETTGEAIIRLIDRDDEIERSLRRRRNPSTGGDRTAAVMTFRAEWLRFENGTYDRCRDFDRDVWSTLSPLFREGRQTRGSTRPLIERILETEERIERLSFDANDIIYLGSFLP